MDQPNGTATPSCTSEVDQKMICPHCFSFITPITTDDEIIICANCQRTISMEDIDVFTEDTTITG